MADMVIPYRCCLQMIQLRNYEIREISRETPTSPPGEIPWETPTSHSELRYRDWASELTH